jgi:hypothetical protein
VSWRGRLATFSSLLVLVLGGLAAVDALTALPSAASHAARADPSAAALQPGRAFVLVIDSLRYQTATSPTLMPHLTALRAQSVFARITPTRDAVTVPCLRAAFTGRDRTRVFGFVENFLKGNAGLESIFSQLAQRGRSAAVYSDGAFDQFGDLGIKRVSNGDPEAEGGESDDRRDHVDEQNATVPLAFADYRSGKHDLVVMHVTYTDHVAHEVGIAAPLYAQRYRAADALVERLARELPASDTLVVMGDHGHDAQGRHALGLDVPTYALYRGPRFVAGTDTGTLSIRDHRYLLGFALGLPLPEDYAGEWHPNALHASAPELGSYAAEGRVHAAVSPGVLVERRNSYGLYALVLACLFAIWLQLTAARALLVSPDPAAAGTGRVARVARWLAPAAFALVLCALGVVFPRIRSFVHEPTFSTLGVLWLGLWLLAGLVTWRTRRLERGSVVVALLLFVAVPTVYRYGAAVAMGPAWLGWLACLGIAAAAQRLPRPPLTEAVPLIALLVPFGFAESSDFRFDEWVLWPPAALPTGFLLLSMLAKLVVFVPPRARSRQRALASVVGLLVVLLLTAVELGMVASGAQLLGGLVLLAATVWLRRLDRRSTVASSICVAALLLLHHYAVRVPASAYYWQDCLLGALVLSARLVRTLPPPTRTRAHAMLLFFAFFASGWVNFAWTLHRLEWRFLYSFWSAAFVESHVVAFVPLLVGRFALPLLAARVLLTHELEGDPEPGSTRALDLAWLLAGSKVASLMFWSYGIAFVSVASDVYLEAVQETCLACALLVGLL